MTAFQLALAGWTSRRGALRLALVVVGVAAGLVLLLAALSIVPARDRQHTRSDLRGLPRAIGRLAPGTPYLLWAPTASVPNIDGRPLTVITTAASNPGAPAPLGADRVPAPGTVLVSPALRDVLDSAAGRPYRFALAGRVVGTLGEGAILDPGELVALRGERFATLQATHAAWKVTSWSAPAAGVPPSPPLPLSVRIAVLVGALGLLIPIGVFIAASTRVAAAAREQRYAALRLVGATSSEMRVVAMLEAALAAALGGVVGVVLALALRPLAGHVSLVGFSAWPMDLSPPAWQVAAVLAAAPLLGAASAVIALRRVSLTPLGVRRQAPPLRPRRRRLLPLAVALGELLALAAVGGRLPASLTLVGVAAGFAGTMAALVLAGPWLVALLAAGLARVARRAGVLIAARRLETGAGPAFRAVSGVALAVFAASALLAYQTSTDAGDRRLQQSVVDFGPDVQVGAPVPPGLVATVRGLPGVRGAVSLAFAADGTEGAVGQCGAVTRAAGVSADRCGAGALVVRRPGERRGGPATLRLESGAGAVAVHTRIAGFLPPLAPIAFTVPRRLVPRGVSVAALAVMTDGSLAAAERVRGAVLARSPGAFVAVNAAAEPAPADGGQAARNARKVRLAVILMLCVAGCSLVVMLVDGLVERRRQLATLVAVGTPARELRLATACEVLVPLAGAAASGAAGGIAVADLLLHGRGTALVVPWGQLGVVLGLCALTGAGVVALTLPALGRSLRPEHLRAP